MLVKNKFGQVSIFVVISAIIVIVGIFLFFNSKFDFFVSHDTQIKNSVIDVVKDCIDKDAQTGVFLLGFQGGYIDVAKEIKMNPKRNIDIGLKIPNWDSERGVIPTINSMQLELNNYISQSSFSCINTNLKALDETLEIEIGETNLVVNSQINKESVDIEASLPISIKEKNSENILYVNDYFVKLDSVRLGDMYSLAAKIYNKEAGENFLEELTLDQIYSASDYSSAVSMPGEGMSFSCNPRVWTIPQLKQNLIQLNNNNFKYLYIDGTYSIDNVYDANLNEEFGTFSLRDYFKSSATGYVQDITNPSSTYKNYKTEFFVPTPINLNKATFGLTDIFRTFEVTPSSGSIVKPMNYDIDMGIKMPIPCVQIYHHLYTLDYDVMARIVDYNEDGNNYIFQFPLRVNIVNNNPKVRPASSIVAEAQTATNDKFCSNESREYPVRIYVKDENSNYLSNVNISYKCISLSCDIGSTSKPKYDFNANLERKYAVPYLDANFPYCVGGTVVAEAAGFNKAELKLNTTSEILNSDKLVYYDMILKPLKSFKVDESSFLIKFLEDGKGKRVLSENDGYIYVSVENKANDFDSQVIWPTDSGYLDTLNLLDDADAVYNVSVIYTDKDYELKGIIEIENWKPEISNGNSIEFIIPATRDKIDVDNYETFYNSMTDAISNPYSDYGIRIK